MNVTKITRQIIGAESGPIIATRVSLQYLAGFTQPIYATMLTQQVIVSKPTLNAYLGAQTPDQDFVY